MDISLKSNELFLKITKWMIICMILIIPIQVIIFMVIPMPEDGLGFLTMMRDHPFLGLLHMDLLYIINNTFLLFFYYALYITLKGKHTSLLNIALITGIVGAIIYYTTNRSVEMLLLSQKYFNTSDQARRLIYVGISESYLDIWKGTGFNTYYFLSAISLILFSVVMIKTDVYSKKTGVIGLISGLLMTIPSGFDMIGLLMSLLSLVPRVIFSILVVKRLHKGLEINLK